MRPLLLLISIITLTTCKPPSKKFYMPAEWEPHEAVWLGWEDDQIQYYPTVVEMIKSLLPHVPVKIAIDNDSLLREAKKYLSQKGIDSTQLKFIIIPGDRYWIRDHGVAFLVNEKGELGAADFGWNFYGYGEWLKVKYDNNNDSIEKYVKRRASSKTGSADSSMALNEKAIIQKTSIVHEGGAIEVNGKGTLILCEATVFNRNPGISKDSLEKEFKRVLGVTNIIWMKKGLADDPHHFFRRITGNYIGGGTGGHTDEFVRFANHSTILLAWVDEKEKDLNPVNQMNYERMSENLRILEQSTDQNGKQFQIIKVPLPDLIARKIMACLEMDAKDTSLDVKVSSFSKSEAPKAGDTIFRVAASSYLNYLVTNGLVILPTYISEGSSKEKEELVKKIFQEQFPDRKIVFINAMPLNWSGGGIHCSTQQQPRVESP